MLIVARPGGLAGFGELGILGKEPVARVDIACAGRFRRGDNGSTVEIAFRCGRRADADGLVGLDDMQRIRVGFRIDRDRRDAEI